MRIQQWNRQPRTIEKKIRQKEIGALARRYLWVSKATRVSLKSSEKRCQMQLKAARLTGDSRALTLIRLTPCFLAALLFKMIFILWKESCYRNWFPSFQVINSIVSYALCNISMSRRHYSLGCHMCVNESQACQRLTSPSSMATPSRIFRINFRNFSQCQSRPI